MRQPNIVFILADDMGYGDFSAFNGGISSTPTLDALMSESACLSQHYAASPVCNPSRASILTGRYPHRTGSIDTLDWRGLDRLALREVTIADALGGAGYSTGCVGKWHLGAFDERYHPNSRGFDEFIGFRGGWQDYWRWNLDRNGMHVPADGRYLTDVFTSEAADFISRHAEDPAPFFLQVNYNAPHNPLQALDEDLSSFVELGEYTTAVSTIYAMIKRMDTGIAQILDTLSTCGLEDDTIVVFTSDNGPQFGGLDDNCHDRFNCNLHGSKGLVYEGGIRVPMIVRWPAGLPGRADVHDVIHSTDIFPTLLAACGVEPPTGLNLDGRNVLPVLRGEPDFVVPRRFWQWNRYTPVIESNAAMRDGDWKLVRPGIAETMQIPRWDIHWNEAMRYSPEEITEIIRTPEPEREVPPPHQPELYNLSNDPLEQHNLAAEEPSRVARMLTELENWFEDVEADRAAIDDVW
jgi:arylsulfatase A-like enzyme